MAKHHRTVMLLSHDVDPQGGPPSRTGSGTLRNHLVSYLEAMFLNSRLNLLTERSFHVDERLRRDKTHSVLHALVHRRDLAT